MVAMEQPEVVSDLLVGWIEEVTDAERDNMFEISVTPASSLVRLAQVDVLFVPRPERRR